MRGNILGLFSNVALICTLCSLFLLVFIAFPYFVGKLMGPVEVFYGLSVPIQLLRFFTDPLFEGLYRSAKWLLTPIFKMVAKSSLASKASALVPSVGESASSTSFSAFSLSGLAGHAKSIGEAASAHLPVRIHDAVVKTFSKFDYETALDQVSGSRETHLGSQSLGFQEVRDELVGQSILRRSRSPLPDPLHHSSHQARQMGRIYSHELDSELDETAVPGRQGPLLHRRGVGSLPSLLWISPQPLRLPSLLKRGSDSKSLDHALRSVRFVALWNVVHVPFRSIRFNHSEISQSRSSLLHPRPSGSQLSPSQGDSGKIFSPSAQEDRHFRCHVRHDLLRSDRSQRPRSKTSLQDDSPAEMETLRGSL